MTRRRAPLALAALALLAAVGAIANTDRTEAPAPAAPPAAPSSRPPVAPSRRDGAVTVARRYALAARNWTAHSYPASWRRQLALATGPYRRRARCAADAGATAGAARRPRQQPGAVTRAARDPRVRDPGRACSCGSGSAPPPADRSSRARRATRCAYGAVTGVGG